MTDEGRRTTDDGLDEGRLGTRGGSSVLYTTAGSFAYVFPCMIPQALCLQVYFACSACLSGPRTISRGTCTIEMEKTLHFFVNEQG